jgi:hypothetical protein
MGQRDVRQPGRDGPDDVQPLPVEPEEGHGGDTGHHHDSEAGTRGNQRLRIRITASDDTPTSAVSQSISPSSPKMPHSFSKKLPAGLSMPTRAGT